MVQQPENGWDIPHLELGDFLEQVHKTSTSKSEYSDIPFVWSEDSGLSNQDLSFCQYTVNFYPQPQNASLNLSQAVNVFGSHLLHYFRNEAAKENQETTTTTTQPKAISQKIFHSITERSLDI